MTVLLTTGIYHVVENDGPVPYWVEVRTFRNSPVVAGSERRVKGFDSLLKATAHMRRLTKEALAADKTLKVWLTDRKGSAPPEASSTQEPKRRGRPPGSKNKQPRRKPGPVPQHKTPFMSFTSDRFVVVPQGVNATAQVYVCNSVEPGNDPVREPHGYGTYAVAVLHKKSLAFACDQDHQSIVYPSFDDAWRDAQFFHEQSENRGLYPAIQPVLYRIGHIEVRCQGEPPFLFHLFDTKMGEWLLRPGNAGGGYQNFSRLDRAIKAADDRHQQDVENPPSMRLISALYESPGEKMERELREDRLLAEQARRDEERTRQWEEDEAEFARLATTRQKPIILKGDAARAAAAAAKAKRVAIKPTQEQKNAARRGMRRRGSHDQRKGE